MPIRLNGSTSGYTEINNSAVGTNNTITLPGANPTANGSFLLGATNGQLSFSTDPTLTSLNGGPLAGFRNRIINGNFDIWQRGTSFSNPADNAYTADRWVVTYNGSGATRTVSQQIFNPGSTEAALGAVFFLRHAQTVAGSGGTYNTVNQRMEGVRTYEGQAVTLSFYARGTSASLTLSTIQLRQNFGAGGSAEVFTTVASSVVIAGSTFARYTYTVTVPSITGKTVGTSASLELIFNLPVNNTFSLDIASVQIEPGPVATPFEQRPIGTELALCQRYFNRIVTGPTGSAVTATECHLTFPAGVPMRTDPTFSLSAPAKVDWPNNSNFTQSSASISASFGTSNCAYNFLMGNFTGLTVHSRLVLRADGGAVSLSAEL